MSRKAFRVGFDICLEGDEDQISAYNKQYILNVAIRSLADSKELQGVGNIRVTNTFTKEYLEESTNGIFP